MRDIASQHAARVGVSSAAMRFLLPIPFLVLALADSVSLGAEESPAAAILPAAVEAGDFTALRGQSPFLRSLNLSDSLILTGFADVEGERVATIMNKETKETYVVSSQLNSQGWKMVDLKTDPDLEKVAAKVAIEGGEVVTVRYANPALKPGESKPASGPSTEVGGGPSAILEANRRQAEGSRERRGPPPEVREKMDRLSEDQRRQLFDRMRELREKNPEMSREDRSKAFSEALDRMVKGR